MKVFNEKINSLKLYLCTSNSYLFGLKLEKFEINKQKGLNLVSVKCFFLNNGVFYRKVPIPLYIQRLPLQHSV